LWHVTILQMILRMRLFWPAAAVVVFLVLMLLTITAWAPLDAVDAAISDRFRQFGGTRPGLIAVVRVVTDVATTIPYVTVGCLTALILWVRRHRRDAVFVAAVTVTVPALWALMHLLLVHVRPVDGFVVVASNGFPSGHTCNATAAALVAVVLAWPRTGGRRRAVLVVSATLFALVIGVSRVMLLAHWPSDVLGGWLLALAVVPVLARLTHGRLPN
jgi:membrane-associated phospholipid phosphatase